MEEASRETPLSNTLVCENKYFSNNTNPMENLPEKLETPKIPYFRQKPAILMADGFSLFFKEIDKLEYWILRTTKIWFIYCTMGRNT